LEGRGPLIEGKEKGEEKGGSNQTRNYLLFLWDGSDVKENMVHADTELFMSLAIPFPL
jgi:hypothetical protein